MTRSVPALLLFFLDATGLAEVINSTWQAKRDNHSHDFGRFRSTSRSLIRKQCAAIGEVCRPILQPSSTVCEPFYTDSLW